MVKCLTVLLTILIHNTCLAINVTFINPSVPGTAFWDRVSAAAVAAADDFDIQLTILYGRDNRIFQYKAIEQAIAAEITPDYIIFMPYDGNAVQSYDLIEAAKIPFVTIERTLQPTEQAELGQPQQKYHYWLGEIFHNNVNAGKLLADALIEQAVKGANKKSLTAIGIAGSFSGESNQRAEGLKQSIDAHHNIELLQVVPAIWSRERSRHIILQLTERFGDIDIAWAASDSMALGVLDSLKSGYDKMNPKLAIGGIDWTVEAIQAVKQGDLAASVGGHIMQTAWALVKIYDHHRGIKVFTKGKNSESYDLEVIHNKNIMHYFILANKVNWRAVNFKQFTRSYTKQDHYQFSFRLIIEALNNNSD
ncbi:hypothetical protein tinsulaeT_36720 [Thalassotalea insulae]|uniref:Periplasmic binding protein domain-containing protein n=1 Tax=Thalassotalea insulae TaxID=2056778 RepID=A0ABQ6GYB8_9GAMM|nr:ABC transporter substrate-binding protein [Thalassotalea insulae]GLX80332.1 hypothetical protein tinsulaeT_36720 [Thalassotalea insulae]